jgi:hypothetical protein
MEPQHISVTPPEITSRLPTLGKAEGGRDEHHGQIVHQALPLYYFVQDLLKNVVYALVLDNAKDLPQNVQNGYTMTCLTFLSIHQTMCLWAKACVAI